MLTKDKMLSALDGLIEEDERLHSMFLQNFQAWTADFAAWLKACESTVESIFGSTSEALKSFKAIYFLPPPGKTYTNDIEVEKDKLVWFDSGLRYAHTTLVGYRYAVERLSPEEPRRFIPYVFISHGGSTRTHVDSVKEFLDALGLAGIIVSDLPNLNLSVNEKVSYYMSLCSGAIILATEEDETVALEKRTRPNVENEVGMLQTMKNIGSRIIYLKESEVKFASNYAEKVWISFDKKHVQNVFTAVAKELRAFGFIGA